MKRIAYLCLSSGWGGLEMNQLRNAQEMQKRGHEVLLIANSDSPIAKAASQANMPLYYIVKQKPKHYQWWFARQLARQLKKQGFCDLFFRNNRELSIAASVHFFSRGKIGVHYFMEMALGGNKTQFFRTLRYQLIDTWVCPLPYLVAQVQHQTNINKNKIKFIHSGISFENQYELTHSTARKQLGWPTDQKILLVVGRIDPKKQQAFIWESFQKRPSPNELLIFVGDPTPDEHNDYHHQLAQSIEGHPKNNQVLWAGFQNDMALFYRAADLVIMAADHETVGMATIEALKFACPVVGANNGGTKELIETYGGGLCFRSLDQNELNLRIDMALNGQTPSLKSALFEQHFDFKRVCALVETEVLGLEAPIFQ
ncbi:MAG: glycosyltransferase family 4 protein [Crocinitomicaceae bacterium]|nr:glycosyltransferase family 4 protein [Crocinitomicaceae bacterium]MDP4723388.1 glycosyltransferase family 4 protein [Crocinitomicaceae bacterium]MDP4805887.1 glycosyltransferase family 4 protein [Crocinitomicaceae bacterium]MDP4867843.1 glycosyltransferase family 4 protein [Crocinitomicaceae bacterium]MDP5066898.1 glycosyltransferase family 4 protein [Crocinitomicaceae bacterium]